MLSILLPLTALTVGAQALSESSYECSPLSFPIRANRGGAAVKSLSKRQTEVGQETQDQGSFYTIDITIGTPGQTVSVNFDTGSDELWVNPNCTNSYDPDLCRGFGFFNESSTAVGTGVNGEIEYGAGWVSFAYVYDYVKLGSMKLSQQIFGMAFNSEYIPVGIMGAGPNLDGWDSEYPLVIDSLVQQGYIQSRAFSLDIRGLDAEEGSVVFGGIDTKKYSGALEKLPIIPASESPDGLTRYWVNLNGLTVSPEDNDEIVIFEGEDQPVLLDSGYTFSALPGYIFNDLIEAFPSAKPITDSNLWSVDCSLRDTEGTLDFTFGETTINVPYADWVFEYPDGDCYIGAFEDDEFPVLGDTFLRAAYVVFDWDNRNIHIANNEDCGSNLVKIGTGPNAVPSIVGECGATPTSVPPTSVPPTSTPPPVSTDEPTSIPVTSDEPTSSPITTTPGPTSPPSTPTGGHGNGTTTARPTPPPTTSTYTSTSTYTITSCPPVVTDCPIGAITTEIITKTTIFCPETTGTYTLPHHTCTRPACSAKPTGPSKPVITVKPQPTADHPAPLPNPDCTTCVIPGPSVTGPPGVITTAVIPGGGSNATATLTGTVPAPTLPVPTGAAVGKWAGAPVAAALGVGAVMAAML